MMLQTLGELLKQYFSIMTDDDKNKLSAKILEGKFPLNLNYHFTGTSREGQPKNYYVTIRLDLNVDTGDLTFRYNEYFKIIEKKLKWLRLKKFIVYHPKQEQSNVEQVELPVNEVYDSTLIKEIEHKLDDTYDDIEIPAEELKLLEQWRLENRPK